MSSVDRTIEAFKARYRQALAMKREREAVIDKAKSEIGIIQDSMFRYEEILRNHGVDVSALESDGDE